MSGRRSAELQQIHGYTDSAGRAVVPLRHENCSDYTDAWRGYIEGLQPESYARQNFRQLAEIALDCPSELAYGMGGVCKTACAGMKVSK